MKTLALSLVTVLVLAACPLLRAQEPAAVPEVIKVIAYKDVGERDRVRLIRTVGVPFTGTVVRRTDRFLRLDLKFEPNGLPAQIDFPVEIIKSVELLRPLSEDEKKEAVQKLEGARKRAMQAVEARFTAFAPEKGMPAVLDNTLVRPLLSERQIWLLTVYPPEFWGPERLRWIRQRWILMGLAPNQTESDFIRLYPEWYDANQQLQKVQQWGLQNRGILLLQSFPPEQGWGANRLEEIKKKQAQGVELNEYEQDFMTFYPDWLKAYQAEQRLKELPAVPEKAPSGKVEDVPLKPAEPLPPEPQKKQE